MKFLCELLYFNHLRLICQCQIYFLDLLPNGIENIALQRCNPPYDTASCHYQTPFKEDRDYRGILGDLSVERSGCCFDGIFVRT